MIFRSSPRARGFCWFLSLVLCGVMNMRAQGTLYRVRDTDGRVREMKAEEYVGAVVAGEAGTLPNEEARKAIAVAARTYAFRVQGRHANEGFDFCTTTHCQRVLIGRTDPAARETAGLMLWKNGRPAMTTYSKDCGGQQDPYCRRRAAEWRWPIDYRGVEKALRAETLRCPLALTTITVVERTAQGRTKTLRLSGAQGSELISASTLRFAVGRHLGWNLIRSDLYRVTGNVLIGRGQGNGVGLCQLGAEEMGEEGLDYRAILRFYYPGTTVSQAASGFEWTRLGGERVTVWTATPNRDAVLVAQAEQSLRWAERRVHRQASGTVQVRVFPDVATFRDATGASGSVAAWTRGLRIDMQPQRSMNGTLRHEMLHVVLEQHTRANVPAWFREELVAYLCDAGGGRFPQWLNRYGEATVLSWAERGLPAEVMYSSSSKAAVNTR